MKNRKQLARQTRVRARLKSGSSPRLSVHRTNQHLWVQLIDDRSHITLAATSTKSVSSGTKSEKSQVAGVEIAKLAKKLKINRVVFDRGSYRYHGRVKALAEAARQAGLEF